MLWSGRQDLSDYLYDSHGKRICKGIGSGNNITGQEVYFYGVDGQKLATYSVSVNGSQLSVTTTHTAVFFGAKRVAVDGTAFVPDRLGSNVYGKYFPYGEDRGTPLGNDQVKFATYTRDSNTGLDYADQRYYSNQFGRFMTPDPYGPSAKLSLPTSWNRYTYVLGDPMNFNDPTGNDEDGLDTGSCAGSWFSDVNGGWDCEVDTDMEENTSVNIIGNVGTFCTAQSGAPVPCDTPGAILTAIGPGGDSNPSPTPENPTLPLTPSGLLPLLGVTAGSSQGGTAFRTALQTWNACAAQVTSQARAPYLNVIQKLDDNYVPGLVVAAGIGGVVGAIAGSFADAFMGQFGTIGGAYFFSHLLPLAFDQVHTDLVVLLTVVSDLQPSSQALEAACGPTPRYQP
jgi:RHS repeat-associated protein